MCARERERERESLGLCVCKCMHMCAYVCAYAIRFCLLLLSCVSFALHHVFLYPSTAHYEHDYKRPMFFLRGGLGLKMSGWIQGSWTVAVWWRPV